MVFQMIDNRLLHNTTVLHGASMWLVSSPTYCN